MKTIILAAGKSTRLLPLTKDTPQSLLRVRESTILERQVKSLREAGVEDIAVITGHLAKKLEESCGQLKVKTLFNPFYGVSGIGASLWVAKNEAKDGFLFLYSDVLFDSQVIESLLKNLEDICLAIKKDGLRPEAEKVVEEAGKAKGISKTMLEKGNAEFIGIAKFSASGAKKVLQELENALKDNLNVSFIEIIERLIERGEIVAIHDIGESRFVDIDFPDDLTKAAELFK